METAFVGPGRAGPGRAGLGHATKRNGPGPKLNSGPRAGPGRAVRSTGRADEIRPVQTSDSNARTKLTLFLDRKYRKKCEMNVTRHDSQYLEYGF